jgi:NADH dehydrogenase [ubiquinone] 1 alpha subcomplex assembly factor 5
VLVVARGRRHKPRVMPSEIFDRSRRRTQRARALSAAAADRWLLDAIAAELADRLTAMTPDFSNILVIGPLQQPLGDMLKQRGVKVTRFDLTGPADATGEEDQLPFRAPRFDCVIAMPGLESVNDLPGALILARRALLPNGLFLGAILGAGTLSTLKRCFLGAEQRIAGGVAARFHPQIDVRAAGDLLQRAGLSQPVADQDQMVARYGAMGRLVADVRANGLGNCLAASSPLTRRVSTEAAAAFSAAADADGKTAESFCPIYLTGWAPVAGEARPSGPVRQGLRAPE